MKVEKKKKKSGYLVGFKNQLLLNVYDSVILIAIHEAIENIH